MTTPDPELVERAARAACAHYWDNPTAIQAGHPNDMWESEGDVWQEIVRDIAVALREAAVARPAGLAPDYPFAREMRALLGKRVQVVLQTEPEHISVIGVLHTFTDHGEVGLQDSDGAFRWCWPNLECREITEHPFDPPAVVEAAGAVLAANPTLTVEEAVRRAVLDEGSPDHG